MAAEDGDDETRDADKLARELAEACTVLGRELSRLAGFVQWADDVVSKAESAIRPGDAENAKFAARCQASFGPGAPERYYIGDGIVAQLIADAEAAVKVSP